VPPLVTPRPRIHGVQTGTVVGKEGNIDVDEYGRILVELHWNKAGPTKTEPLTMRCRVMQSWAGQQWGTIFTPRHGMEVLVEFIDGDPDRPLVVGCVYNKDNMPPYKLPGGDNKNISGWKTRSTEGGSDEDYNEFVFDDTRDKEVIRLHAQKDLDTHVEHDEKRVVDNDRVTEIKHDDKLTVTNDLVIEAKNTITIKVGSSVIVLDQSGISVDGLQIAVTATAALSTEGKGTATHKAGGPMTISGIPVKIN
jgi:type VI secretion system secreted protein VgrG